MNKKSLITAGWASSVAATVVGISLAIFAYSPNTISRGTVVAALLGVLGVTSFFLSLVSKE